jgi:hypothetical protein
MHMALCAPLPHFANTYHILISRSGIVPNGEGGRRRVETSGTGKQGLAIVGLCS